MRLTKNQIQNGTGELKMGVDIYLNSIWEPWFKAFETEEKAKAIVGNRQIAADLVRAANNIFDVYRRSGGYFRNGYNSGDVMWAMGLSWPGTVLPMLDAKQRLPVDRARELVALIEARPLTREVFARHFLENMTNGVEQHPISGPLDALTRKAEAEATGTPPPPLLPPDFDQMLAFVSERRKELLAILRKSIELGEPLECSL